MRTVFGLVADELGLGSRQTIVQGSDGPQLRTAAWSTSSLAVRSLQPPTILVDVGHSGRAVGRVVYLQRSHGQLLAVAEIADHVQAAVAVQVGDEVRTVATDVYFSAEADSDLDYHDIELRGLSLVAQPAQIGLRPLQFRDGPVAVAAASARDQDERELLTRASEYAYGRARTEGIRVVDLDEPQEVYGRSLSRETWGYIGANDLGYADRRPPGPIRHSAPVRGGILRVR